MLSNTSKFVIDENNKNDVRLTNHTDRNVSFFMSRTIMKENTHHYLGVIPASGTMDFTAGGAMSVLVFYPNNDSTQKRLNSSTYL